MPVVIWDRAVADTPRTGQHLKAEEGGFGSEDFILVAEEGADDVTHDAFAAAAGDHVFNLEVELLRENLAEIETAVGVEIEAVEGALHRLDGLGGGAQRILVGGELGDAREAVLLAHTLYGAAGFIGSQRFDIRRYEWHRFYFSGLRG